MMSDTIEAASRSLEEANEEIITKPVNHRSRSLKIDNLMNTSSHLMNLALSLTAFKLNLL